MLYYKPNNAIIDFFHPLHLRVALFSFFFLFNFAALKSYIFKWQLPHLSKNYTLHSKTILPSQKRLLKTNTDMHSDIWIEIAPQSHFTKEA